MGLRVGCIVGLIRPCRLRGAVVEADLLRSKARRRGVHECRCPPLRVIVDPSALFYPRVISSSEGRDPALKGRMMASNPRCSPPEGVFLETMIPCAFYRGLTSLPSRLTAVSQAMLEFHVTACAAMMMMTKDLVATRLR